MRFEYTFTGETGAGGGIYCMYKSSGGNAFVDMFTGGGSEKENFFGCNKKGSGLMPEGVCFDRGLVLAAWLLFFYNYMRTHNFLVITPHVRISK